MKTQPLRQDKHCLNCGAEVPERYCTHCGQENAVPHESFGHLVKHFVGDVLHYDSQFLKTLNYLLFRPGRLTREYMAGRRVAYVNPIKLYIFISFVFFLSLAMLSPHESHEPEAKPGTGKEAAAAQHEKDDEEEIPTIAGIVDSVRSSLKENNVLPAETAGDTGVYHYRYDTGSAPHVPAYNSLRKAAAAPDTTPQKDEDNPLKKYRNAAAYDSAQAGMPKSERDGWLKRYVTRKAFKFDDSFEDGFTEALKHHFPKMMFVLLPLFALWLKLIYNWKRWYYADHAIFSLHVHCFAYVLLLIAFILEAATGWENFVGWGSLLIFGYLVLALRNTYRQSFMRSFAKALLLLMGYSISFAFVGVFFILIIFAVIL